MSTVVYPGAYPQYTDTYNNQGIFDDELLQSYWFWILLLIAIIALAIAIGVLVWIGTRHDQVLDLELNIQENASATTTSDTFNTEQYDMYLGKTTVNLNLNIPNNSTNIKGRQLYIKNDGTGDINLDTRSLVAFNQGRITNGATIESGVYAVFVFIASNNLLRLQ